MIGNVIQSKFLVITDYPAGGGALVHADGGDPRARRVYARVLGTERLSVMIAASAATLLHRATPLLAFGYLLLPIAVVIAFSFNDPVGRFNYTWEGFTLDHWRNPFASPGLRDAIVAQLQIAALASRRRDDPRDADRARARPLRVPRPRRRRTCSSSCR